MEEQALIELHRHLDGSLRWETLMDLAKQQAISIPTSPQDVLFFTGMGLEEALARFSITLSVLQTPDSVCRVASEMCEDAAQEGVEELEIRFAPQLHLGGSLASIVDAAVQGVSGRAGIILCGLYGEAPEVLQELVEIARTRPAVCGIDLAGGPAPHHSFSLLDYAPVFQKASRLGLGRTVHAGEGRPPQEIAQAIQHLQVQRIGHGTTLLEDERVLDLVLENEVVIEACPTSNVHTGVIASVDQHPIVSWLDKGVLVSICTDNTLLSSVNAIEEYERVSGIPGMTKSGIERCIAAGRTGLFERG